MKNRDTRFDEAIKKAGYGFDTKKENAKMLLWKLDNEEDIKKKDLILIRGTGYVASRQQLNRYMEQDD